MWDWLSGMKTHILAIVTAVVGLLVASGIIDLGLGDKIQVIAGVILDLIAMLASALRAGVAKAERKSDAVLAALARR